MTFQIKAPETIPATLTISGQGREQKLKLVYRHKELTAYRELLDKVAKKEIKPEDAVLEIVESWEADMELSAATIRLLAEQQPGADWAIVEGYGAALAVARKGN